MAGRKLSQPLRIKSLAVAVLVILMLVPIVSSLEAASEAPKVEWEKTYGPVAADCVVQTSDDGYAVAGEYGVWAKPSPSPGYWTKATFLLVKTDASGNVEWSKTYGEAGWANSLVQTDDGGYALAGIEAGSWVLMKTDAAGNMQWSKTLLGPDDRGNVVVIQTKDGGFAVAGSTRNWAVGPYLIKTDKDGNTLWNVTYEGQSTDDIYSLVEVSDGGYAMVGMTSTFGGAWLIRADVKGNALWNKTYATGEDNAFSSLINTNDGGFLLVGMRRPHDDFGYGWVVKTDSQGNLLWNITYKDVSDQFFSVAPAKDGGYVFAGECANGTMLVKTNATGGVEWSILHGEYDDIYHSVIATSDGGYAVAGLKHGEHDSDNSVWLVKIAPEPYTPPVTSPSEPEPFPIEYILGIVAAIVLVLLGATVYILKRKQRAKL